MLDDNTFNLISDSTLSELGKDSLDNEVWIFDYFGKDIREKCPMKLQMPIFAICVKGSVTLHVNLNDYTITQNCLIILSPESILQGITASDDAKGLLLGVGRKSTDDIIPDIHTILPMIIEWKASPIISLSEDDSQCLQEFHALLWKLIKSEKGPYRRHIVHNILRAMLYKVLDIYKSNHNIPLNTKRSRNDEIFYNFIQRVEKDFKKERSVQYYADKLFITPKYLTSVIKAMSGQTASDWINNYVILEAKVMLRSSSKTILEISNDLNFTNQSFFGKYFKLHTGMSPQAYRKRNDNKD